MPLSHLRSDEELLESFRSGDEEAFCVIHDRYRQRLFAYSRRMLLHRQDAEDATQDVFERAYAGLRTGERHIELRGWLFRVAHNRCIDELRRADPYLLALESTVGTNLNDPLTLVDRRESLRLLLADVRDLPGQQRAALLLREFQGVPYDEIADTLGVSVSAVKSLLLRARATLANKHQARTTACSEVRESLMLARRRGVRPTATAGHHLRECASCRRFRRELRLFGDDLLVAA